MNPISITPINKLNLQKKFGTLSNYAQTFIKSQVKSISFSLERFLEEVDSKLISQNEQRLKEIGIKQIGKDLNEGIIISDNKFDYHVFSSNGDFLDCDIIEPESNQLYRHFSLNKNSNNYRHAGNFSDSNIEDEMSKILDFVEGKILEGKRECLQPKIPQPFIPEQTTTEKITKLKKTIHRTRKIIKPDNAATISTKEEELIASINEKFKIIQGLYKKIPDGKTKYQVRNQYKNYLPQPVANKIGFKNAGENGESISFFHTTYKYNTHNAITVTDVNGNETIFVISEDMKTVQKNFPTKNVRAGAETYRICIAPNYYTQKEVDESNLHSYLSCLNKEMEQFIEYTQNWFDKKEEQKLIRSNSNVATLDKYKDILDDIYSNFENYRTKMRIYLRKPHKSRKFKNENSISTKITTSAVKFDNITPEGYDLRLSFPKVRGSIATQLLVMRGDKIENSFFILYNKLLRFNIKDLNDKINHLNKHMYFYDNKYLQESNLHSYLLLNQD